MKNVNILDRVGDIDIRCSSTNCETLELHVDSDHDVGVLRVRLYGADQQVMMERLVRSVPSSLKVRLPDTGTYAIEVAPLPKKGQARANNLTWSDWAEMMGADPGRRGGAVGTSREAVHANATLRVA
jgi:hypothetical protein